MAYDSRIILGGQGPDVMGSVAAGNQVAAQTNALRASNELANLYRTQGAGILAGDKNALNALAGIDPNAALGVQGAQLGMDATRQNMAFGQEEMQMKRDQIKQAAAEHAATLTAEQRAAEAAQIETGVKAASTAQTPEQWDAIVTQFGQPDLVGQFGMKDALLASYADVATILKGNDPAKPSSDMAKLNADLKAGLISQADYDLEVTRMAPKGMRITSDGNGNFTMEEGPGVTGGTPKPFTEAQSKDVGFATRAEGANAELESGATALTNLGETAANSVPFGLGKYVQSDDYKLAQGAGLEFLTAFLRKDSGAAITPQETAMYGDMFLPRPGDGEAIIAQKAQRRKRAIDAIKAGMSPAQIAAQEAALANGQPAPSNQPPALSDDDLLRKYGG